MMTTSFTAAALRTIAAAVETETDVAETVAAAAALARDASGDVSALSTAPIYAKRRGAAWVITFGTPASRRSAFFGRVVDAKWKRYERIATIKGFATRDAKRVGAEVETIAARFGADFAATIAATAARNVKALASRVAATAATREIAARANAIAVEAYAIAQVVNDLVERAAAFGDVDGENVGAALRDVAALADAAIAAKRDDTAAAAAAERAEVAAKREQVAARLARAAAAIERAAAPADAIANHRDALAVAAERLAAAATLSTLGEVGALADHAERFAAEHGAALADVADVRAVAAAAEYFAEIAADAIADAADALAERAEYARRAAVVGGAVFAADVAALAADLADLKARHGELVIATSTKLAAVEIAAAAIADVARRDGLAEIAAAAETLARDASRRCGSETRAADAIGARFAALVGGALIVSALAVADLRRDARALAAVAADMLAETARDAIRGAYGERAVAALVASAKLAAAAPAAEIGANVGDVEIAQVAAPAALADVETEIAAAEIADAALTIAKAARRVGAVDVAERAAKLSGDARRYRLGGDIVGARRRLAALAALLGADAPAVAI